MAQATEEGAMMAVAASKESLAPIMEKYGNDICIGVFNAKNQVVVTGKSAAVHFLASELEQQNIYTHVLTEKQPVHHPNLFEGVNIEKFMNCSPKPQSPKMKVYSSYLNKLISIEDITSDFWYRSLTSPVHFDSTIHKILKQEKNCAFFEVSAKPILGGHIQSFQPSRRNLFINKKSKQYPDDTANLQVMYESGYCDDFGFWYPEGQFMPLPTYPWQNVDLWHESETSKIRRLKPSDGPFLGVKNDTHKLEWENKWTKEQQPWLNQHIILGQPLFPGAGYIEMMLSALESQYPNHQWVIEDIQFQQAIQLGNQKGFYSKLCLEEDMHRVNIQATSNLENKKFSNTCHANYRMVANTALPPTAPVTQWMPEDGSSLSGEVLYRFFDISKYQYGPLFRGIQSFRKVSDVCYCTLEVDHSLIDTQYRIHPVLLDIVFQSALANRFKAPETPTEFEIPVSIAQFRLFSSPTSHQLFAKASQRVNDQQQTVSDIMLYEATGKLICTVQGLRTIKLSDIVKPLERQEVGKFLSVPHWEEVAIPEQITKVDAKKFIFLKDNGKFCQTLEQYLLAEQHQVASMVYNPMHTIKTQTEILITLLSDGDAETIFILGSGINPQTSDQSIGQIAGVFKALASAIQESKFQGKCWFLTQNAHTLNPDLIVPSQRSIEGLALTFSKEYAQNYGGVIDLNVTSDLSFLLHLFTSPAYAQEQLMLHGKFCAKRRLVPKVLPPTPSVFFNKNHHYLVTGAFGALGQEVVRWMVTKNARHLVLTTSQPVPAKEKWPEIKRFKWLYQLTQEGVKIECIQMDLANKASIQKGLSKLNLQNISGVIYAAGVSKDEKLANLSLAQFEKIYATKVTGVDTFLKHFRNVPLEYFCIFSSVASLMPNQGMASYAAANAYLDALAEHWGRQGQPVLSINWGAWSTGMVEKLGLEQKLAHLGIKSLKPHEGIQLLEKVLMLSTSQILVHKMDWHTFLSGSLAQTPLFQHYREQTAQQNEEKKTYNSFDEIKYLLLKGLGELIGVKPSELSTSESLMEQGLDSLSSLVLLELIEKNFSLKLSNDELQDGLSVEGILDKIQFQLALAE